MFVCPECDRMLTRCAVLALALRKLAGAAHRTDRHDGADWKTCQKDPCQRIRRTLETAGVEGTGTHQ